MTSSTRKTFERSTTAVAAGAGLYAGGQLIGALDKLDVHKNGQVVDGTLVPFDDETFPDMYARIQRGDNEIEGHLSRAGIAGAVLLLSLSVVAISRRLTQREAAQAENAAPVQTLES